MNKSLIIRKLTACLLICILSISITPIAFIHSIAADHKDKTCELPGDHYCATGINCKCLDLVAEGQFLATCTEYDFVSISVYAEFLNPHIRTFTHPHLAVLSLRGPPAAAVSAV